MAGAVAPILRHFLANETNSLLSDEILARVRGMIADVAGQLLDQLAKASGKAAVSPQPKTLQYIADQMVPARQQDEATRKIVAFSSWSCSLSPASLAKRLTSRASRDR